MKRDIEQIKNLFNELQKQKFDVISKIKLPCSNKTLH